jgi:predicted RNA-binding protein with TRAM domain
MVPYMLESGKRGGGVDRVNGHTLLVPNMLETGKRGR